MALQNVFIGTLILSIISIFAILIAGIAKIYKARILIHLAWCLYCLLMIFGFLIGAILVPLNGILIEGCDYIEAFINDE